MANIPLSERLRPEKLNMFVGQKHLTGKDGIITKLVKTAKKGGFFPSLIFWGPPGSGKTTLARIIANEIKRKFYEFSAVNTSTKEIEEILKEYKFKKSHRLKDGSTLFKEEDFKRVSPIIFVDEIHRFNKAQQDKLLPYVERGEIILIGATTENPSFEVIGPLLSRSRVITLNQLSLRNLGTIINRGLKKLDIKIEKDAKIFLIESSNGDARVLLNVLEIAFNIIKETKSKTLKTQDIEQALQRRQYSFDKKGEEYYNVISAFIKSLRASNPDAAIYYLARMIEAGQDPLYIARRMVIFASEDIGIAQPTAIVVANEVFKACEVIGYPECSINLAHAAIYLANAKKDRSAYNALQDAVEDVRKTGNLPIPLKLRNPVTKLNEDLGYGKDYEMYTDESLLPEKLINKVYFKKGGEEQNG